MKKGRLIKGFGIGIILLFLGSNVLPNVCAKMENITSVVFSNTHNSDVNFTYKFIGIIKNLMRIGQSISFTGVALFYWFYDNNGVLYAHGFTQLSMDFTYNKMTGFVSKHFIFATFIKIVDENASGFSIN